MGDEERTKFANNSCGLDIVESPKPVCFDGVMPSVARDLVAVGEERRLWCMTGAQGLFFLTVSLPNGYHVWFGHLDS